MKKVSKVIVERFKDIPLGGWSEEAPFKNISDDILSDLECRLMFVDAIGDSKSEAEKSAIVSQIWWLIADYVALVHQITKRNNSRDLKMYNRTEVNKKITRLQRHLKALKEISADLISKNDSYELLYLPYIINGKLITPEKKERIAKLTKGVEHIKTIEEMLKSEIEYWEQVEKTTNTYAINFFCDKLIAIFGHHSTKKIKMIELTKDIKNLQTLIKSIADHVFKNKEYKPINTL